MKQVFNRERISETKLSYKENYLEKYFLYEKCLLKKDFQLNILFVKIDLLQVITSFFMYYS